MAREGFGETRPRTDRVASDRRPRRQLNDHAGGGLPAVGASRGSPDRRRAPLPTRVDGLPRLPAAYDDALETGLAGLWLRLDAAARSSLEIHVRLFLAWNEAFNLTSITEPGQVAVRHVLDSLTAVSLVMARGTHQRIVDIGSGAGYPGLALAVALPTATVTLVESVAKKARFLETVTAALGLAGRVSVVAARAESLAAPVRAGRLPAYDVATARAVGGLADLVELGLPLLATGGLLIAWKRGDLAAELAAARRACAALGGGRIDVHDVPVTALAGHCLVSVEKRGPTPAAFPRPPGRRRADPW